MTKKRNKSISSIKIKPIRNPRGYKVTDIDKTKRGVTIFYKKKK